MSPWSLLAIPAALGLVCVLLVVMTWAEDRILSPRSLILYFVRSRHAGPDECEKYVAVQSELLLGPVRRQSATVAARP